MKIVESIPWVYYLEETSEFEDDKVGCQRQVELNS